MKSSDTDTSYSRFVDAAWPLLLITFLVAAWFTHVIACIGEGFWGFLIAGALFFPIAIIHGVMIWFGFGI